MAKQEKLEKLREELRLKRQKEHEAIAAREKALLEAEQKLNAELEAKRIAAEKTALAEV